MRFFPTVLLIALLPEALIYAQGAPAPAQEAPQTAQQLVKDVIYNELNDRERDSFWEYRSHCVSDKKDVVREQVETAEGPIYRVLASRGRGLAGDQESREEKRLANYLRDPAQIERVKRSHESDEARLAHVMQIIPNAYTFEYEGAPTGDRVRLKFVPNPSFVPGSYEDRILYGLGGEMVVDQRQKRMISMDGTIQNKIEFGYGLLGSVEPGGTFHIHRLQVSATHWKTDLVDVHVQGKVLIFSDISKEQRETRWGFVPVPHDISLERAAQTLQVIAASYESNAENARYQAPEPEFASFRSRP